MNMDLIASFNDCLVDFISVYPHGKTDFINNWLNYISIEQMRFLTADVLNHDIIYYLYSIDKFKIEELAYKVFAFVPPYSNFNTQSSYVNQSKPTYAEATYVLPTKPTYAEATYLLPIKPTYAESTYALPIKPTYRQSTYVPPHKRK